MNTGRAFDVVISAFDFDNLKDNDTFIKEYMIRNLYKNPRVGQGSASDFAERMKPFLPGITKAFMKEIINNFESVQTHRQQKHPHIYRHFQSFAPNDFHQCDAVYLPTTESGYKYLLTVIDVYSLYLAAEP